MGGLEAALTLVGAVADEILTRGEAAGAVGTTATPASSTAPPATSTTRSSRRSTATASTTSSFCLGSMSHRIARHLRLATFQAEWRRRLLCVIRVMEESVLRKVLVILVLHASPAIRVVGVDQWRGLAQPIWEPNKVGNPTPNLGVYTLVGCL
ncbi:hypothetical protein CLOM_g11125 [Closterium sp. NIES-68]|nr:hypothetical protein CLOM_g11125 [Closterium sp. NIES-68]